MAATPSILVRKHFSYRGTTKEWSNRYHFNGGTPADSAHWTTLSDAIVTAEKAIFAAGVTIDETIGYQAGSEVPVFTKTYTTTGTLNPGSVPAAPGDCCAIVRYSTTARTPKNHPIYLFNYWHGVWASAAGGGDTVVAAQVTAMGTYAAAWISGFSDGTTSYNRAGPNGATAVGYVIKPYIMHRDFN